LEIDASKYCTVFADSPVGFIMDLKDSDDLSDPDLKIILLGDSAVGKSKLIERYLMNEYDHRQVLMYMYIIQLDVLSIYLGSY
jgi:GTPase SAR1 family protein